MCMTISNASNMNKMMSLPLSIDVIALEQCMALCLAARYPESMESQIR